MLHFIKDIAEARGFIVDEFCSLKTHYACWVRSNILEFKLTHFSVFRDRVPLSKSVLISFARLMSLNIFRIKIVAAEITHLMHLSPTWFRLVLIFFLSFLPYLHTCSDSKSHVFITNFPKLLFMLYIIIYFMFCTLFTSIFNH